MIVTKYSSPHIYHSLFNRALPPLSLLLPIVVTTRPDHHHHPSAHHIVRNHCEYSYSCTFEYLEQYLPDDLSSTQMESIIIVIRQGGKNNHPEANLVHGLIWKSTKACKPAKIIHNLRFKIPISSDADADGLFFKCRVGIKGKVEQGWLTQLNASEWELHESIHTIPFCKRGFCFHSHPHLQVFPAPSSSSSDLISSSGLLVTTSTAQWQLCRRPKNHCALYASLYNYHLSLHCLCLYHCLCHCLFVGWLGCVRNS